MNEYNPNVKQTIKLTVKGTSVEISREDAKELHAALGELLGEGSVLKDIKKALKEIDRQPFVFPPPIIPQSPSPKPWITPRPEPPWKPHEFWCSTSGNLSLVG